MNTFKSVLFAGIIISILFLVWGNNSKNSPQPSSPRLEPSQFPSQQDELIQRIALLESQFELEKTNTAELESRLQQLENATNSIKSGTPDLSLEQDEPVDDRPSTSRRTNEEVTQQLITANIPLDTIQSIQDKIGQNRLDMLALRDKATRENWINTLEYSEKVHELSDPVRGIRDEFGDETYDAYLYASGRSNRVLVQQVYRGSAAETAGIQSGDIILSYATIRIFTMNDLRQATVQGVSGETVLVEISRNGSPFATTVPRGPLGISMNVTTQPSG